MKKIVSAVWVLALLVSGGTSYAWHVDGYVLCGGVTPIGGVHVRVTGTDTCGNTYDRTAVTDVSQGYYSVDLEVGCTGTGSFQACVNMADLPLGATLDTAACISFTLTFGGQDTARVSWSVTNGECTPPPPPCPACVDPVLGLGAAAGCTVLELGPSSVSITGPPGGILGDICIAPNGRLSMSGSEYITGTVKLGPGATFQNSSSGTVGGVQQNVDLSAEIAAAYAAASADASLPCTQSYGTLDGKTVQVIAGSSGINVICVQNISLSGKQILLTGPSDAKFIFNVTGKLVLTGGGSGPQIRVDPASGIHPSAVLYNIIGTGQDVAFSGGGGGVNCCAAIVDGTILAPYRKIALSPGLVNGQIISSMNISIVSGSSVRCPPCP